MIAAPVIFFLSLCVIGLDMLCSDLEASAKDAERNSFKRYE
jgi:hypothetical protein